MLKADLHIHTKGDPVDTQIQYTAQDMLNLAAKQKFDVLGITWHNKIFETNQLKSYAKKKGITLLQGVELTINNQHITSNSQVFVTFRDDLAGRSYYVSSVNDGSNFTVKLSGNLATDVYFSYWIVDSDNSLDAFKAAQESADEPEEPVIDSETPTSTATTTP